MALVLNLCEKNLELIKLLDSPYYFLEYFLFRLNNEQSEVVRCDYFNKLCTFYQSPYSAHIFSEIDFKGMIDILVRSIENVEDSTFPSTLESSLKNYVQCYLILSIHKNIILNG